MKNRALVIGASGGIGAALSDTLASSGVLVTNLSRSDDGFDITNPTQVDSTLGNLVSPFDTILIASGILAADNFLPEKSLSSIDLDHMTRVMAVNAIGPALVLKHVPNLLPRKERAFVGVLTARVGSIGDNRLGGWYSYRASKAAANQIVRTAAIEISRRRPEAIVAALHPGTVNTSFTESYPNHEKVSAATSSANLLGVLYSLSPKDSGGFFDWAGKPIPW